MKSLTILTLFSMISTGIQNNDYVTNAPERAGSNVINALKKGSVEEYNSLLPSLSEFLQIMEINEKLYGGFLSEAKTEFTLLYQREVIPSAKVAFTAVVNEGIKRGIDWRNVEFVTVKTMAAPQHENPVRLDIVFREKGKEYTVRIENAFFWSGELKVAQFIELI